jgi:AsmA-like C-terminal region
MQSGFWRKCRVGLRWLRRGVMAMVLAAICAFFWLNLVGLPEFLKLRLVESLREHGVELQFERMRLSLVRGIVAEKVHVGQTGARNRAAFSADEVRLELDYAALFRGRLQLNGLVVREGSFTLPLSPTNVLALDRIQTDLHFLTSDTWSLNNFQAGFAGARLKLSGEVAHAPELRRWQIFRASKTGTSAASEPLKKLSELLQQIHFTGEPQLSLNILGDARDVHSFTAHLLANAPDVRTPWGGARGLQLNARLTAPAEIATNVPALPGFWTNLQPFRIAWTARAAGLWSGKFRADTVECDGIWHAPELAVTKLSAQQAEWAPEWTVRNLEAAVNVTAPAAAPAQVDASWSWWTNLQPFRVVWRARLAQLKSDKLNADFVACAGIWNAPEVAVTNLSARLGGGTLAARARLNVATREFSFTNDAHFDVHAVAALLSAKTRERLAEFSWTQPPSLQAAGSLVLPAWTNQHPDWRGEVQPTIRLNGKLALTNASMDGVAVDSARTHFIYSNLVWHLPDLALAQSRTRLRVNGQEDDGTKEYRWRVRGAFDPASLRPSLTTSNAARGLSHLTWAEPVHLDAEISGRLYDYDSITATGRVALTNFTVRGQHADSVTGEFSYTNRVLVFSHPRLWRGAQTMTADTITLEFDTKLIRFKNGFSTAEPESVARAIGPKTGEIMEPYHFLEPPTVFVEGCAPLRDVNHIEDVSDADLRFDVVGGVPFQCLKFKAERLTGTVHWLGQKLILTDMTADLYGGMGAGSAIFDFRAPHEGADYQFTATLTNVNLHALATDLASPTNHLEGVLAGEIVVTRADSRDWRTLDGYGHARLRDGLLWDIPVFGILSPALNTVSPGLGNSRATDAEANFTITNGVIHSDSLEVNTATTRLEYAGTVDLKENVNARVTAQLLHNVWGVGPVISTVFYPVTKLFEYKITGTLKEPKHEPVYVPKFLLMPLHPIRSLEDIFSGGGFFSSPTNTPAGN